MNIGIDFDQPCVVRINLFLRSISKIDDYKMESIYCGLQCNLPKCDTFN